MQQYGLVCALWAYLNHLPVLTMTDRPIYTILAWSNPVWLTCMHLAYTKLQLQSQGKSYF